jgi:hypothetical protein
LLVRLVEPFAVPSCLLALGLTFFAGHAGAQAAAPVKPSASRACSATPAQVAALDQAGHLLEAKAAALACSKPSCSALVGQQCRAKYALLEAEIPSVVPVARDEAGQPLVDVEVRMDGQVLCTQIDGSGHDIDPGVHEFTFSAPGRAPQSEKILIVQGQRNHQISVILAAVPAATPTVAAAAVATAPNEPVQAEPAAEPRPGSQASAAPKESKTSVWPYVVGGTGLAALGLSIALVTWGHQDLELLDGCAPNCSQNSLDHVQNLYLAADISLAVGVGALGVATWMFISNAGASAKSGDHAELRWDVAPTRGGAFATMQQSF